MYALIHRQSLKPHKSPSLVRSRGRALARDPFPRPVQPAPRDKIGAAMSGGHALREPERTLFESRFRHDFGRVRIHDDARADAAARAVSADAYTQGDHVVFRSGRYAPGTLAGRRLLAHELVHVLQQSGRTTSPASVSRRGAEPAAVVGDHARAGLIQLAASTESFGEERRPIRETKPFSKERQPIRPETEPERENQRLCDHPDCRVCPLAAQAFFRGPAYLFRCAIDRIEINKIEIEICRSGSGVRAPFLCTGKATIQCPGESPEVIPFAVWHPGGKNDPTRGGNRFVVWTETALCEFKTVCVNNKGTLELMYCRGSQTGL